MNISKSRTQLGLVDRLEGMGVVGRVPGQQPPTSLNAGTVLSQELRLGHQVDEGFSQGGVRVLGRPDYAENRPG